MYKLSAILISNIDEKRYILIHKDFDGFNTERFLQNYENFKLTKKLVFLPLFNKFHLYIIKKINNSNYLKQEFKKYDLNYYDIYDLIEYYSEYSEHESNQNEKFTEILNIFTLKELNLIVLLIQDLYDGKLIYDHNRNHKSEQWLNHTLPNEDYQQVLNS